MKCSTATIFTSPPAGEVGTAQSAGTEEGELVAWRDPLSRRAPRADLPREGGGK